MCNRVVPGVPLHSAPGYALVAPAGRVHSGRVHPMRGTSILCPNDNTV